MTLQQLVHLSLPGSQLLASFISEDATIGQLISTLLREDAQEIEQHLCGQPLSALDQDQFRIRRVVQREPNRPGTDNDLEDIELGRRCHCAGVVV